LTRNEFPPPREAELAAHLRTYRSFVRGALLFAAHVAVILALLAYFLTGSG
jgi:Bacterial aa3 type cytochrome c oxidase subunit IV